MCTKIPRESTHLSYPAICFSVKEVVLNAVCKLSNWRQDYKMNYFNHSSQLNYVGFSVGHDIALVFYLNLYLVFVCVYVRVAVT